MSLLAIVQGIQDIVLTVTGIRAAPDYPPDSLGMMPIAVAYTPNGTIKGGPGYNGLTHLHDVTIEVHYPRTDLAKSVEKSMGLIDTIPQKLFYDPTLGGSASHFESIDYEFGYMTWGDPEIKTFGPRFFVRGIKEIGQAST